MNWQVILPLLFFLVIIFGIGIWANKQIRTSSSFLQEYFLGGREMGGFLLAMTMMATMRGIPQIFAGDELMFVSANPDNIGDHPAV